MADAVTNTVSAKMHRLLFQLHTTWCTLLTPMKGRQRRSRNRDDRERIAIMEAVPWKLTITYAHNLPDKNKSKLASSPHYRCV